MEKDYDSQLDWYRCFIERHKDDKARRIREYCSYLKRWFGDGPCDGAPNYETRYLWKRTPMSYTQYFIE